MLFDPETVIDNATFDAPQAIVDEISVVWVNGEARSCSTTGSGGIMTRFPVFGALCLVIVAGCADDGPLGPLSRDHCSSLTGRSYSGSYSGGTWLRRNSPHVLKNAVVVAGELTIEQGSLICAEEGARLTAGGVFALGSSDTPILFTSMGAGEWDGLEGDSGTVRHARIENTVNAIRGGIVLEDVHIVRTRGYAVSGSRMLRNVVIDSACTDGSGCTALTVPGYTTARLENITIRHSGGGAIGAWRRCALTIDGGLIEGSAGVGIAIAWDPGGSCGLAVQRPVRITGGGSYPVRLHGSAVRELLRSGSDLTGNARDTLMVEGWWGLGVDDYRITRELPWHVRTQCGALNSFRHFMGTITIEAGASLAIDGHPCIFHMDLVVEGTPAEPAILRSDGMRFYSRGLSTDTLRIRHAVLRDIRIRADSAPIIFEDVELHDASLELLAAGSRIDGLRSVGSAAIARIFIDDDPEAPPAITLGASTTMRRANIEAAAHDGILVAGAGVTISQCTVTASARHAIRVSEGAPVIRDCNLFGNGGFALSNTSSTMTTDAVDNWWGDPAGPFGPAADGVDGAVHYAPFQTAPVLW